MARLGELTDAQTPLLRDLERAAPGLNDVLHPPRAVRRGLAPGVPLARRRRRDKGTARDPRERATRSTSCASSPPNAPAPRQAAAPAAPDRRRPQPRPPGHARRRDRAARTRTRRRSRNSEPHGVHRRSSRSGTTSTGRRSRSTSSTRSRHVLRVLLVVGSECAPYANAEERQGQGAPASTATPTSGPYQPGVTDPDPTEDGGARRARRRRGQERGETRGAGEPEAAARARASATPSQAADRAAAGPPGRPERRRAPARAARRERPAATGARRRSPPQPAPDQLLDFLLAP